MEGCTSVNKISILKNDWTSPISNMFLIMHNDTPVQFVLNDQVNYLLLGVTAEYCVCIIQ